MYHPDTNFDYPKRELMHPTPYARFARVSDYVFQIAKYPNCHFGHLAIWQFPPCPQSPKSPPKQKQNGRVSVPFHYTEPHPNTTASALFRFTPQSRYNSEQPPPQCRTKHPLTRFARPRPPPQKSVFFILFAFHAVFQISKYPKWQFDKNGNLKSLICRSTKRY